MHKHRRIIGTLVKEDKAIVEDKEYHHLINVLRIKQGERFELLVPDNGIYMSEVERIEKDRAYVKILRTLKSYQPYPYMVWLAFALFSENRMRFLIEKATEIGISGFLPFISARSKHKGKIGTEKEGWKQIILNAMKQSENINMPKLLPVMTFEQALSKAKEMGNIFLLSINGRWIDDIKVPENNCVIFIGPEGGFTEEEEAIIMKFAKDAVKLNTNILRSETAGIIAAYEFIKKLNKRR